jgi:hypothetical protein
MTELAGWENSLKLEREMGIEPTIPRLRGTSPAPTRDKRSALSRLGGGIGKLFG